MDEDETVVLTDEDKQKIAKKIEVDNTISETEPENNKTDD